MTYSRRDVLKVSAAAMSLGLGAKLFGQRGEGESERIAPAPLQVPKNLTASELARDESFWKTVANQFQLDPSFCNLENGYYGIMPVPVHQNYLANTERLNSLNSQYLRYTFKKELENITIQLADVLGVGADEVAITRGGTEALQNLISGYNKLQPGDQVLYADLDYYSCHFAIQWLPQRRGVSIIKINIPEPADKQSILDVYAEALEKNPRIKLMLVTHLNNRTGLVLPVAELVDLARQHGVDTIADVAHSFGHLDFKLPDLKADFIGVSLHKWIHAPLGLGCIYIRKNRITDIDPAFGDDLYGANDVRARVHSGTKNVAPVMTLPTALQFHNQLGAQNKQERLRYLRNHWVSRVSANDRIEILTPNEPSMHGAITSFRIKGRTTTKENEQIAQHLLEKHRILTVPRNGVHKGDCIRVTPALFTTVDEVERLAVALMDLR